MNWLQWIHDAESLKKSRGFYFEKILHLPNQALLYCISINILQNQKFCLCNNSSRLDTEVLMCLQWRHHPITKKLRTWWSIYPQMLTGYTIYLEPKSLPKQDIRIALVFQAVEKANSRVHEWGLADATLEDVFIARDAQSSNELN